MTYDGVTQAVFLERLNRFAARVCLEGRTETVHVKNTGRCAELLVPGREVWLTAPGTPGRKTEYDLVAVRGGDGALFNIDSLAPNKAVGEWLDRQDYDRVVPEYRFGSSRIDFYMERGGEKHLMEVKGCTLVIGGIGYFPDAPTERGARHLRELAAAAEQGYKAAIAFVIQTNDVTEVRPNTAADPAFAAALQDAKAAGVEIKRLKCRVEPDRMTVTESIS